MDSDNNFYRNRISIKRCERAYTTIFLAYTGTCIPYAVATFVYALFHGLSTKDNLIFQFTLSILLALVLFATGLLSIYRKELKYTFLPVPASMLFVCLSISDDNIFLNYGYFNLGAIFISIAIISSLILMLVHKKYRWLEEQEGFPYFNERFEKNKNNLNEYNNNNPYQQSMEKYKNSSSGKMDDI